MIRCIFAVLSESESLFLNLKRFNWTKGSCLQSLDTGMEKGSLVVYSHVMSH
jgi:hypothetical protein